MYSTCRTTISASMKLLLCFLVQDPNVKLIRELRVEIKRLKRIIEKANLVSVHVHVYIPNVVMFVQSASE